MTGFGFSVEHAKRKKAQTDRDLAYEWLGNKFERFEYRLNPEERTELDGILWELSEKIACANKAKSV